jgi:hypothetical protein
MATKPQTVPPAEALSLHSLITPTQQGIASRVLARTAGGNLTLFAFDAGQRFHRIHDAVSVLNPSDGNRARLTRAAERVAAWLQSSGGMCE